MAEFSNLGALLKEYRIQKGFTQAALAEALNGLHSQFVSNWERGQCAPPSHCFHQLLDLLKVNRKKVEKAMLEDARLEIRARVYSKKNK